MRGLKDGLTGLKAGFMQRGGDAKRELDGVRGCMVRVRQCEVGVGFELVGWERLYVEW